MINKYKIIKIDEIEITSLKHVLYIIGNGFDLIHNVPSRYKDFGKFLKSKEDVKVVLDYFIDKDDIWGDFEDSLTHLDRELMMNFIDILLEDGNALDEDDKNFSAAGFFAAQELVALPGTILTHELPHRFRKWVNSLKVKKDFKPLANLMKRNAKYITFNYTEFLETIYNIPKSNILYIHGDRREKEQLILGHGYEPNVLQDKWIEKNKHREDLQPLVKDKKGKLIANDNPTYLAYFGNDLEDDGWFTNARYHAINGAIEYIENYYEESLKKTKEVLIKQKRYINQLKSVEHIIVIGHSLSNVDYPYFEAIIKKIPSFTKWYFTYYDNKDLKKIDRFVKHFNINRNNVSLLQSLDNCKER